MPATIAQPTFIGVDKNIPVYVPENSVSQYQYANFWHEFTNYRVIGSSGGGNDDGGGDDTGIEDATAQQVTVCGAAGAIVLDAAEGRIVRIYNVQGSLVWQGKAIGEQRIDVPANGLYLVAIEGVSTRKAVVTK